MVREEPRDKPNSVKVMTRLRVWRLGEDVWCKTAGQTEDCKGRFQKYLLCKLVDFSIRL